MSKTAALSFTSKRSLLALRCPADRDFVEAWHETIAGFGVRIMSQDARGNVRRTYLCRYTALVPDGQGGTVKKDRKERLGLVDELDDEAAISYDDALEKALALRRVQKEQRSGAGPVRMTVGDAWASYASEKQLNRESTHEKDKRTYERALQHLENRFLDELQYTFWSDAVSQLKAGSYVVGTELRDGKEVPVRIGPYAAPSVKAILNVASNLYEIARKHKGLPGLEHKENPARDAKELIGTANKRRGHLPLKKVGPTWRAADQLVAPAFRDLFRVLVLTGLRRALVLGMTFAEIDFEQGVYLIDPRKPGTKRRGKDLAENAEHIKLPLSMYVLNLLKARREFAPDPAGPVFYSQPMRGEAAAAGVITDPRTSWTPLESVAGMHFTPHDLRRTFATLGVAAPGSSDVFALSLLMLHSGSSLAKAAGVPAITVEYINTDEAQDRMRVVTEAITSYVLKLAAGKVEAPEKEPRLPDYIESDLGVE